MASMTPPLKTHGGKHYMASRIVPLFPPHGHYVEPYAGGLSVLIRKPCEGISEVANDLNRNVTNFWKVLQDAVLFPRFERRIQAVPFSQHEWDEAMAHPGPVELPELDAAVAFFIAARQSLAGLTNSFSPLSRNRTRRGQNEQTSAWLTAVEGLPQVHERLKRVVILNDDANKVIKAQDGPQTCFYADPPYLPSTRTAPKVYQHEMTWGQHEEMLDTLVAVKGKVLVSGYRNDLYDSRLASWRRLEFELPNNAAGGESKRRMVECLWCNFDDEKKE